MAAQFHPKTGGRGIEWCDETRNATGGCFHDCKWEMPDGTLTICYAKELAESGVAKKAYPHGFEHHYWRPEMLKPLVAGREPLLIFCDSMSDLFAANVPESDILAVLNAIGDAHQHTYQSLTKAPPQLLKYAIHIPPNLWVGVSSPPDCRPIGVAIISPLSTDWPARQPFVPESRSDPIGCRSRSHPGPLPQATRALG